MGGQRGRAKYVLMSLFFKEGRLGWALHPCVVSSLSGVRRKWWPGLGIWVDMSSGCEPDYIPV